MWTYEMECWAKGFKRVAGVDEAGRGPLAGPVVSAAVILRPDFPDIGIRDSKKLSPRSRLRMYEHIYQYALCVGIGIVDAQEIDRSNILAAALLSMRWAVANLAPEPDFLLVDGKFGIRMAVDQWPIIKGDSLSISIAAASIIAKETRDRMMYRYDLDYPQFGFAKHKGYPTKAHREAIHRLGPCYIHRRSFKGVKEHFNGTSGC